MNSGYLFGFDVGTSESKATLIGIDGHVVAYASTAHEVRSPSPGFAEHDPVKDWIGDLKKLLQDIYAKSGIKPNEIKGIGISTIMAAVTPVDENCQPLRNAILYGIDTRCIKQADELNSIIGKDKLDKLFGGPLGVDHFGPKILWIKENEPELYNKTKKFTFASGFLTARLTGNFFVDKYSASAAFPMYNPEQVGWDDEMCKLVCPKEMLPTISDSTYSIVGEVTKQASEEIGFAVGTPVICGTTDAGAEAVSVGVVEPGDTMLMYGSTSFYISVTKNERRDSKLWFNHYTINDTYSCAGGMATTGSLTKWIRNEFAKDLLEKEKNGGEDAYTELIKEAEKIKLGSDGLIILPYFLGERMPIQDPLAKGMMFGLTLNHTRGHIMHAAYEGIGYGINQNIELMREAKLQIESVMAVGGGTKSDLWLQIVSDITNIEQKVPEVTIGASYGDALMAGLATGFILSPTDIKKLVKIKKVIKPNMENHEKYKTYINMFDELYKNNKQLMHKIK